MTTRHIWLIAKKELLSLYHERTIILAIALQLFIAMFSSFLIVGLTTMYDPAALSRFSGISYGIGYAGADSPLPGYLEKEGNFRVYRMDLSNAVAALRERKLAGVLYIPDTPPASDDPVVVTLYLIQNDLQSSMIGSRLKDALSAYESDLRDLRSTRLTVAPIKLLFPPERSDGDFFEFIYGLLIPLLLFLPVVISAALIIDFITEEYQLATLETLLSSPVSFPDVILGKIVAAVILVPLQAGAWLLLLATNGVTIAGPIEVLFLVSLIAVILICLSALIALHYRERTNAQTIFSVGLVIVLLAVLAIPQNPVNMVVRIATATAGPEQWPALGFLILGSITMLALVRTFAGYVGTKAPLKEG